MADATGKAGQWGKRDKPDTGFEDVGRNAADISESRLQMRSEEPMDRTPGLDTLSLEIHAELFHWLDARARACVALCSTHLSRCARLVRRIEAGTLLDRGQTRPQAWEQRCLSEGWLQDKSAEVARARGWQHFPIDFRDFNAGEYLTLEALGIEAGARFMHINGLRCHQPLLDGIVKASGWQSLSACYSRRELQQGLNALAKALAPGDPAMRRELSLRVFDCEEKFAIDFPIRLNAQCLDLVELYLDQVIDPADLLPCFSAEHRLQSLEILVEASVPDAAQVVVTIGRNFPELRYFRLVSYQPFGIAPHVLSDFFSHHPKLNVLDLNHVHFGLTDVALDFSLLNVNELILNDFHLADPDRAFEAWIARTSQLEKLEIELHKSALTNGDPAEEQVRNRLLDAMASNAALTELRLKGEAWVSGGDDLPPCDSFLSLMDSILSHPTLDVLQIPVSDIRGTEDLLNGALRLVDSQLLDKLTALESLQPKLKLTLGEFEMETIRFKTSINGSDQRLMQSLQGWSKVSRMPGTEEVLEFKVTIPVWGDGAFRRFMKFCSLAPDRQQRYLIGLAKRGNLVEGSLKIVRL